jgi:hypothetical protein
MNYGPLRDSPNRVQRFVLESHWRSSMAIGLFGAGVGALLAAFRGIPLLVSALINVPILVLGSLGVFFFSSARHMTPSERQEMVVPYLSDDQNDSATELSQHTPVRPTDWTMPSSAMRPR